MSDKDAVIIILQGLIMRKEKQLHEIEHILRKHDLQEETKGKLYDEIYALEKELGCLEEVTIRVKEYIK